MTALAWCLLCPQDVHFCMCKQQVNRDLEAYRSAALPSMPWAASTAPHEHVACGMTTGLLLTHWLRKPLTWQQLVAEALFELSCRALIA